MFCINEKGWVDQLRIGTRVFHFEFADELHSFISKICEGHRGGDKRYFALLAFQRKQAQLHLYGSGASRRFGREGSIEADAADEPFNPSHPASTMTANGLKAKKTRHGLRRERLLVAHMEATAVAREMS